MKKIVVLILALGLIVGIIFFVSNSNPKPAPPKVEQTFINGQIKFLPIGDSYTIGLGVNPEDRWPNLLVEHLKKEGIDITLVANPAVSGYTVQDAIRQELPEVKRQKPNLITILIGANDNFRDKDEEIFKRDFQSLLDNLENISPDSKKILITIPDYSKSPAGSRYGATSVISESVNQYNNIIKEEAEKRGLKVMDIFPLSQTMTNPGFYIDDGLHPSAKGYAMWEKEIYPVIFGELK